MWDAALAALRAGWGGAELDLAGAMTLAAAAGAQLPIAAELLRHFQAGLFEGQRQREARKQEATPDDPRQR